VLTALLSVLGDEYSGRLQGVTLFLLDASLALVCTSSCLGIGHTEDVVSLNTAVETAVSWDGVAELIGFLLSSINTVEDSQSILISLFFSLTDGLIKLHSLGGSLSLLSCGSIGTFHTVELVDG